MLVAPFMKVPVLADVLAHARTVPVTCITRWQPEEVAAGVSDLDVFDLLAERPDTALLLWPPLHAKYFRGDRRCLVGSANLTGRALGWVSPANIELLIEAPSTHPRLSAFEERALAEAKPATAELRALVEEAAAAIRLERDWAAPASTPSEDESQTATDRRPLADSARLWTPSLRQPPDLYLAYSGRLDELTAASREAALRDLAALDPPGGLLAPSFAAVVAASMLQMPLIARIDEFTATPQRFGAVRDLIAGEVGLSPREANVAWQTTMRWLMHFLPDRYRREVPSHSEVFGRVGASEADETTSAL